MSTEPNPDKPSVPAVNASAVSPPKKPKQQSATSPERTVEGYLDKFDQLAGLVTIGYITPAQANSAGAQLNRVFQYLSRRDNGTGATQLSQADFKAMVAENPALLNMFAHLLTPEQLAALTDE